MTAQNNQFKEDEAQYFHVYREAAREPIFTDKEDFQIFTNFLQDYFSNTTNLEDTKKTFTVRGRTYQGVPHQPKNFFNQIELLAYKLEPDRFDLLIKQTTPGTLKKFIRALSTRYAIYFNKRHHRAGSLFKNPYKSPRVEDVSSLLDLTRNLHNDFSKKDGVSPHYYSSRPEYLGQRKTDWVKPEVVLSTNGVNDYRSFLKNSELEKDPEQPPPPKVLQETTISKASPVDQTVSKQGGAGAVEVSNIEKRAFLKLIGATGLSFFLASLFSKRIDHFLGKTEESGPTAIQDPAGNIISPAKHHPTDNYKISEVDYGINTFYGFIDGKGGWFIMKEDIDSGTFRYIKGDTNFNENWNNRENLNYDYYNRVFPET